MAPSTALSYEDRGASVKRENAGIYNPVWPAPETRQHQQPHEQAHDLPPQTDRGLPGHAILRGVLPLTLGLALVPRRFSGSVMGCSAVLTLLVLRGASGPSLGPAAVAALLLTGPLMDLALWNARPGWRLYVRL